MQLIIEGWGTGVCSELLVVSGLQLKLWLNIKESTRKNSVLARNCSLKERLFALL